ncbi:MAG: hypothetical protein QM760_01455 [Nibricoccus sp.]
MKKVEYVLFNKPISRRTYYWLLFLCPFAAFWIYLSSRRVTNGRLPDVAGSSQPSV